MEDIKFPKKFQKKLETFAPEYMETVDGANTDDIKKMILSAENNIYQIDHEKENNEELLKMKEALKEITEPFTEAKTTEAAKIKYCLFTLGQRNIKL